MNWEIYSENTGDVILVVENCSETAAWVVAFGERARRKASQDRYLVRPVSTDTPRK